MCLSNLHVYMKNSTRLSRILHIKLFFVFWLGNWKKSKSKGNLFGDTFLSEKRKPTPNPENGQTGLQMDVLVAVRRHAHSCMGSWRSPAEARRQIGLTRLSSLLPPPLLTKPSPRWQPAPAQKVSPSFTPRILKEEQILPGTPVLRSTKAHGLFPGTSARPRSHWLRLVCPQLQSRGGSDGFAFEISEHPFL